MSRYVVTSQVTIPATDYQHPAKVVTKSQVVELSAAEVTTIGAGNLRAITVATVHDQQGEAVGVSNGS